LDINKKPLVSICIPTYNGEKYIEETIKSALNQSYKNIEIIITDDCSKDKTLDICNSFKDKRIKIFKNSKNLGLVGNWKECVNKASSKWIKFLFQDDLIEPNCVEIMIDAALSNNVNFIMCDREYIFEEGVDDHAIRFYSNLPKTGNLFNKDTKYTPEETSKIIAPYIFKNCLGEPPTILMNKDFYKENDFPNNYFQLIDYIFALNKILKDEFVFVSKKLLKFRVHNDSTSKKNNTVDPKNPDAFNKFLYIKYYEKIQLCHEILYNPLFKTIKALIPSKDIEMIKRWIVMKSYREYGFENVFSFYKNSKLSNYIIDNFTSDYSLLKYRIFKVVNKKYRKKYKV